jgi:hypothetical protein
VIIQVKKIQHQKKIYKGALFFHPSVKTNKLIDLLRSHHVDCKSDSETKVAIFIGLFVLELIFIFLLLLQGAYFPAFLLALATIFRFTWPEIGITSSLVKIPILRNSFARWLLYLFLVSTAAMTSWEHVKSHGITSSPSDHGGSQIRRRRRH